MSSGDAETSTRSHFGSFRGSAGKGAAPPRLRSLSGKEFKTLEALVARVIPSDETPGAKEACVAWYIDAKLALAHPMERLDYKTGLSNIDKLSSSMFRKRFADAAPDDQDHLLRELEMGEVSGWPESSSFFSKVRQHTVEGFLCDPKHGGNRDYVGWKFLGAGGDPEPEGYTEEEIRDALEALPFYSRKDAKNNGKRQGS